MIDKDLISGSGGIVVVQARNGSSRLPGKTMMNLGSSPVLAHVINRLRPSRFISKSIIVATTTNPEDDSICSFCTSFDIPFFRGHSIDVFSRFLSIYEILNPSYIVRVTGDCPFINASIVDSAIDSYLSADTDYVSNTLVRSFPKGFDVECFRASLLSEVTVDSCSREHVTPFIYNNIEYTSTNVLSPMDFSHIRCTLDNLDDYNFISYLLEYLSLKNDCFDQYIQISPSFLQELLDSSPELLRLHTHSIYAASCYDKNPSIR